MTGYTLIIAILWWCFNKPGKRTARRFGIMWSVGMIFVCLIGVGIWYLVSYMPHLFL